LPTLSERAESVGLIAHNWRKLASLQRALSVVLFERQKKQAERLAKLPTKN
jgi:hypothetical protein